MVDRPQPGKIYLHKQAEVEVISMHGVYCWVLEKEDFNDPEDARPTPYTVHADHLSEAPLKPGDKVLPRGVMGTELHEVIAVVGDKVWHRNKAGADYVDFANLLLRVGG